MSESRKQILNKIKMALAVPTPLPFPEAERGAFPIQPLQQDLVVEFAEQFTLLQGKFMFCMNETEMRKHFIMLCSQNSWTKIYCSEAKMIQNLGLNKLHPDVASCEVAITGCEFLVARTGSAVLSSTANDRIPSVYAPIHICIAYTSQIVYDVQDALAATKEKYGTSLPSLISFATGPSRTADIEKTLVVGVHGPKEVYCFLIDDSSPA
ncbi:MAG TPA: LUD domain-containing protein [Chitinophagaceae bacterium]|nr:LUD domain-containing protein [Chitinophagaceae bacterium]